MLADLKEKEQHKFRSLHEVRRKFARMRSSAMRLFTKKEVADASRRVGIKDRGEIAGLQELLVHHPDAILNVNYWKSIGKGAASAFFYGKADIDYSPAKEGGPLSRDASSLERIGGSVGTGVYKAGRALQKAEKWFDIKDPAGRRLRGKKFSPGSAFGARGDDIDKCISKRVGMHGGKFVYIGHEMGTAGYERCLDDENEKDKLADMKSKRYAEHLPEILRELGVDPDKYMKHRAGTLTHRQSKRRRDR